MYGYVVSVHTRRPRPAAGMYTRGVHGVHRHTAMHTVRTAWSVGYTLHTYHVVLRAPWVVCMCMYTHDVVRHVVV